MRAVVAIFCLFVVTVSAYARTETVLIEDMKPNSENKIAISDFGKYTDNKSNYVFDGDCYAVVEGYYKRGNQAFRAGDLSFRAGALIVSTSVDMSGSGYEYTAVTQDGRKFKVWTYVGGDRVEQESRLQIVGQCN